MLKSENHKHIAKSTCEKLNVILWKWLPFFLQTKAISVILPISDNDNFHPEWN